MTKLTKRHLLKHLNKSDKQDIILEVLTLFCKFKNVKEFYKAELSEDGNPLLANYKKRISEAYTAANPKERRTNLNLNRLLREFRKVSISEQDVIDLMLHRVECGLAAIERNGKRSAAFCNCILSTFRDAIKLIDNQVIINDNKVRIEKIIESAKPGNYNLKGRMEIIFYK